jgi:tRNA pseudouridine38-40 synthase
MRYFIYFSYNGTAYHGWQIQPNGISVQEVLTNALRTVLREEIDIVGAGRTDTGVHARLMVAHFDTDNMLVETDDFVRKLNSILPKDIAADKVVKVKADAHARFDALSRKYEYHVYVGKNVFKEHLALRLYNPVNFELMNAAAAQLVNYSDFTSFSKLHTDVKTNNCVIANAKWEQQGDEWVFTIEADRFLRNMVRSVVGTLFDVGIGKITIQDFCQIIEVKDRCKAGVSVPAHGLYLVDIRYPENIFE